LLKINSHQQVRTASLLSNHVINSLFKKEYTKNSLPYCLSLGKLILKQWLKVKSSVVDTNNCLNRIFPSFDSFHKELSSGFRLVDNFSDYFSFHIVNYKDKKSKEAHLCKLNKIFKDTSSDSNSIFDIFDANIKNNVYLDYNITAKTIHHAVNITSTKTELFATRCEINQAIQVSDVFYIIVITDSIYLAKQIFNSLSHSY